MYSVVSVLLGQVFHIEHHSKNLYAVSSVVNYDKAAIMFHWLS